MPTVADVEVASTLRKFVRLGRFSAEDGWLALETYRWMAVTRYSTFAFLDRIWELRDTRRTSPWPRSSTVRWSRPTPG